MPSFFAIVTLMIISLFMATATISSAAPAGAAQVSVTKQQAAKSKAKAKAKAKARAKARARARERRARMLRGPSGLSFYTPVRSIPARHGTLIWSRVAGGSVPLQSAASTRLILYSSTSVTGDRVAVSGSVSIPKGKAPAGGWPVISYGHGTTGIADQCAPSRNTVGGVADGYISYTDPIMNSWLDAGYVVARTDYEGLGTEGVHPFLVGKSAGRGILDIVRAAHQMNPAISKDFVITGHSQGGNASLFAADQAATWTPELKLKGTVAYAPASQLKEQLPTLQGLTSTGLTPLATMIVRGMDSVYPEIDADALLSDEILPFYPETLTKCLSELSQADSLGSIRGNQVVRAGADTAGLLEILGEQNPVATSAAPIVLAQGLADTTTLPGFTDLLSSVLRRIPGNRVSLLEYPGVNHGSILQASAEDVDQRIQSWLPSGR
jgi:alpha-beta hydrolase superfamily lysophospholipase